MSEILERVLMATGFVLEGTGDVSGLRRAASDIALEGAFAIGAGLAADAVYVTDDGPKLVIKEVADRREASALHERAWNLGLAPLLWIVTPIDVSIYDAFRGVGQRQDGEALRTFRVDLAAELDALDRICGRFSLDTGAFWSSELAVNISRHGKVDRVLLEEIHSLEEGLVALSKPFASHEAQVRARMHGQELITCTLFASFLLERGIAQPLLPDGLPDDLAQVFESLETTRALLDWLHVTFNGDVFPAGMGSDLHQGHLILLKEFVEGTSLTPRSKGQMRLFRFRFDTIPIELISSVYEAFARRAAGDMAKALGLHYTSVELVHMALDPVFEGLQHEARILDPTCGSGIFLVQSLRRLVSQRCGNGARPRGIVRGILYSQVFGIDIEPAALRVAAFSLYLAALELETEAGSSDRTQFDPLIGLTLHRADFLSLNGRSIAERIRPTAIVGNPPWTHGALKTSARMDEEENAGAEPSVIAFEGGARRSPDQRFLGRAIEIMGGHGRLAMYLKAAPFLSRSPEATRFREKVIRSLSRLALLNLSPLRHEDLFSGAKSPGLLLCANCGSLPDESSMLAGTFPWTPDFVRSGALALSSADVKVLKKCHVIGAPSTLKAIMLGTDRDARVIERMEREFEPLSSLLARNGIVSGQGFQMKGLARNKPRRTPGDIAVLPAILPRDYEPISTDDLDLPSLPERGIDELLFARARSLYRAPLLLFPKSAHGRALQLGRTSAAISTRDIAFSHGFYGLSFADSDPRLAVVLCALLNSAVPGYQFLFGAGALGIERPSIELQDLRALRVPDILLTDALVRDAREALAAARMDGCKRLDAFAARLYGLGPEERDLVGDAIRRGRSLFTDRVEDRANDAAPPTISDLSDYALGACKTVNAVLRLGGDDRRLVADVAVPRETSSNLLDRFGTVHFTMQHDRPRAEEWVRHSGRLRLDDDIRDRLLRSPTPYLRERRSVRVYGDEGIFIIKPAQRRYWTAASGMEDGDAILADHRMRAQV